MSTETKTLFRVRESFSFDHGGRPFVMQRGDIIDSEHPAASRTGLLEPMNVESEDARHTVTSVGATEDTSAAPGTKRPAPSRKDA